ncbi:MalY/PatB family protein [Tepidanaerobacter acetatoxydans]|uniref:MalY/PatB family protein n=1 Tax=Tepidanaerobacter acetatoxydans TaxID=499229 RepID=UPI001BD4E32D|nr:MalY/PatB family protein [Tepidanaerobacter acetatoxydans]
MYEFDYVDNAKQYSSEKWYGLKEKFGSEDLIPLWVADMDFKAPQPVIDRLMEVVEFGVYGNIRRPETYYNSIINWMRKRYNWEIKREWIGVASRIIPSIGFAIRALTQPGDNIIIQPPVYDNFSNIIKKSERKVVTNPLIFKEQKYYMDFLDLEKKAQDPKTKMLIISNPHNPVGRVWTRSELTELGRICLKHNVIVICDQAYADLTYPNIEYTPYASICEDFAQNCITCNSLSKPFNLAGIHTAYMIIPNKNLFDAYDSFIESLHLKRGTIFSVIATEAAYEESEEWLNNVTKYINENLQYMKCFIKDRIPNINVIEPEFAYLVWLDLRNIKVDSSQLNNFLVQKAKIAVNDGRMYGENGAGFVRMNIACPRNILKSALERIEFAVNIC